MRFASIVAALIVLSPAALTAQTRYRGAVVVSAGQLHLTTTTGRTITPAKDSDQVSFADPEVADNRRSVGWLALFPNCCTSYPIPMKLVVRTGDRQRTFEGDGLPIWRWAFADDGKRVALRQSPVHGDAPAHYELRDIETGKLVSSFISSADSASVRAPQWVRSLDGKKPTKL